MNKIIDEIFGEMEYKHSWKKEDIVTLWGNKYNVAIKAAAYENQQITENQRQSYLKFIKSIDEISKLSLKLVTEYINTNYKNCNEEETKKLLRPKTILFKQDGSCGILCDFEYDIDNGIVISVYPEYEVGPQDIFL